MKSPVRGLCRIIKSYSSVDQNSSSEIGELWSDSGCTMKPIVFADEWDVGERKESKVTIRILAQVTGLMELPFIEIRKTAKGNGEFRFGHIKFEM